MQPKLPKAIAPSAASYVIPSAMFSKQSPSYRASLTNAGTNTKHS